MLKIECDIPCLPYVGFNKVWKKSEREPLHPIILKLVSRDTFTGGVTNSERVFCAKPANLGDGTRNNILFL